jgi:hypothetical protein
MREITETILREMSQWPLFEAIGHSISLGQTDYDIGAKNWRNALRLCQKIQWASLQLQVRNRIFQKIHEKNYYRRMEWNSIVGEINPRIDEIVKATVINMDRIDEKGRDVITESMSWDLMMICMEVEYSDVIAPFFFVPKLKFVYQGGHFPCGWSGKKISEKWASLSDKPLPPGKILIY